MDIIIKNLSYTYQPHSPFERKVLHDIQLEIKSNQWTAIIGKTGSGKSTLIQHMNGLLHPTKGSIQIGDVLISSDRKKHPPLFQKVGMVFQYPEHQLFEETVAKDIAFGPKNLEWPEELIHNRIQSVIKQVGLDATFLERSPFALSGGQKRRVAIAGVLVMQPQILILDEPTAGLDPSGKKKIMQVIKEWKEASPDRSVVLITHQMDDVAEHASDVVVLADGKVKWHTDPFNLFTRYHQELEEIGLAIPQSLHLVKELNKELMPPIQLSSIKKDEVFIQIANYFKGKDLTK